MPIRWNIFLLLNPHRQSENDQDVEKTCKEINLRNALILGLVALCLIIGIGVPMSVTGRSGDSTGNANLTTAGKKLTTSTKYSNNGI